MTVISPNQPNQRLLLCDGQRFRSPARMTKPHTHPHGQIHRADRGFRQKFFLPNMTPAFAEAEHSISNFRGGHRPKLLCGLLNGISSLCLTVAITLVEKQPPLIDNLSTYQQINPLRYISLPLESVRGLNRRLTPTLRLILTTAS